MACKKLAKVVVKFVNLLIKIVCVLTFLFVDILCFPSCQIVNFHTWSCSVERDPNNDDDTYRQQCRRDVELFEEEVGGWLAAVSTCYIFGWICNILLLLTVCTSLINIHGRWTCLVASINLILHLLVFLFYIPVFNAENAGIGPGAYIFLIGLVFLVLVNFLLSIVRMLTMDEQRKNQEEEEQKKKEKEQQGKVADAPREQTSELKEGDAESPRNDYVSPIEY